MSAYAYQQAVSLVPAKQLARIVAACPGDLAGTRDRALLLLLEATGLGRDALVGLDADGVRFDTAGASIVSDQARIRVPRRPEIGRCPVRALQDWLDASDTRFGPVFRKVDRWGNVEHRRLGADAVRRILARRTPRRRNGPRKPPAEAGPLHGPPRTPPGPPQRRTPLPTP